MSKAYFKEIFEYPIDKFKIHLENDSNERILFSGKYGIGKSTFLEEFFLEKNQQNILGSIKYNVFRVYPINYSISANEDIIKYIKYDIIIELLKKSTSIEEIELEFINTLPLFLKNNLHKVAASMLHMIPKLGKDISEFYEKIDKLKDEFLKFHSDVTISDGDKMINYLERLEMMEGSIFENDVITKIIAKSLLENKEKESILIVDDVDRLDPEHVFRILNVFASHFENGRAFDQKNKFNFSKIVIVCDFNNIRNIFHHRYGNEVDFRGYVDKFYSLDVFHFDNKLAIKKIIRKVFESAQFKVIGNDDQKFWIQLYFDDEFLLSLINLCIDRSFISLRSIVNMYGRKVDYHYEKIKLDERNSDVYAWIAPVCMQLKLLRDYLLDYKGMNDVFEKCRVRNEFMPAVDYYFGSLIFVLSSEYSSSVSNTPFFYKYKNFPLLVEVNRVHYNDQVKRVRLYSINGNDENGKPQKGDIFIPSNELFWSALIDVSYKLHQIDYMP